MLLAFQYSYYLLQTDVNKWVFNRFHYATFLYFRNTEIQSELIFIQMEGNTLDDSNYLSPSSHSYLKYYDILS